MWAIKYPRYLGGNNSFEQTTEYLARVYMAQYSGLSYYPTQPVNVKVNKFLQSSGAAKGFLGAYICEVRLY